jgi:exonuclease III
MTRIVHWNGCGIREKRLEIDEFLRSLGVKIFVVNETKLDPNWDFNFKNFKRVGINNSPSRAWGTAVFVHYKLTMKLIYLHSGVNFEAILIRCTLDGKVRDILATYWPGEYRGEIEEWRRILRMVRYPLIFVGDLNAHHTGLLNSPQTDSRGRLLQTIMEEYNLVMISHGITYQRPHQAGSSLDVALVSTSLAGEAKWTGYTESLGSDHIPGILDLGRTRVKGDTYRVDWKKYRAAMDNVLGGGIYRKRK